VAHAYINGFGGSAQFGLYVLDVESCTLHISGEAVDTTNTGDNGWESNILGAKAFEGSCKTFWDAASIPTSVLQAGERGTLTLAVGDSGHEYVGEVQITSLSIENPTKGVVSFSLNFKGSGELTY
jgi:predicted secreted protein